MFKTHKMGIRYLNGELFSNETQWREDMFRIVYDLYVKAVHCEKKYRDTGMWLPGHGATDDIIFFYITWQFQTSWLQKIPINVAQVENAVNNENIK